MAGQDTLEDVLVAGTTAGARFLAGHDALQFLMAHEPDAILPHVAFDKLARVFQGASVFAEPHLARFLRADEVPRATEWVTRVVLAYGLSPRSVDLTVEADTRRLVRRYLLPALIDRIPTVSTA